MDWVSASNEKKANSNPGLSSFPSQTTEPWGKDTVTNKGALSAHREVVKNFKEFFIQQSKLELGHISCMWGVCVCVYVSSLRMGDESKMVCKFNPKF